MLGLVSMSMAHHSSISSSHSPWWWWHCVSPLPTSLHSCSVISASLTSLVAYLCPDFSSQAVSPPPSFPLLILSMPASKLVTRLVQAPQGGSLALVLASLASLGTGTGGSRQDTRTTQGRSFRSIAIAITTTTTIGSFYYIGEIRLCCYSLKIIDIYGVLFSCRSESSNY